jgi:hypothetical protein
MIYPAPPCRTWPQESPPPAALLFRQPSQNVGCHITNTNEARAPYAPIGVTRTRSSGRKHFGHSTLEPRMRVLPSPFIQIDHTAHRFTFGSSSRKREPNSGVSTDGD